MNKKAGQIRQLLDCEFIAVDDAIEVAKRETLEALSSCCNVPGKTCVLDIWQGDLRHFVGVLIRELDARLEKQ